MRWRGPSQALEPHICKEIMELHHKKHHQAYVTGLNDAEKKYTDTSDVKTRINLQAALKFNGGGPAFPTRASGTPDADR